MNKDAIIWSFRNNDKITFIGEGKNYLEYYLNKNNTRFYIEYIPETNEYKTLNVKCKGVISFIKDFTIFLNMNI